MSPFVKTTGMSDPPIRANVVTDAQGQENTSGFQAILTQLWQGWVRTLTTWANIQGATQPVTFDAGAFTATGGGGTWTVSAAAVQTYSSRLVGDTLIVTLNVYGVGGLGTAVSVVAGTVTTLKVAIPTPPTGRYICTESVVVPARIADNGTYVAGEVASFINDPNLYVTINATTSAPTAFTASPVNGTWIGFEIACQVVSV